MRKWRLLGIFLTVALMTATFAPLTLAADTIVLRPVEEPASEVWVKGSANVTDWEARSDTVNGRVEISSGFWSEDGPAPVQELTDTAANPEVFVKIPVKSFKSWTSGMDENIYKYLKAKKHPYITYELELLQAEGTGDTFTAQARGTLTAAGTPEQLEFPATVTSHGDYLTVEGEVKTEFNAFDIEPPTAALGSIWAHKEITLGFKWNIAPETE